MDDHGAKMFDVHSVMNFVDTQKKGKAFDHEFYEDQKDPEKRLLVIARVRVRKEYYDHERRIERRNAVRYAGY